MRLFLSFLCVLVLISCHSNSKNSGNTKEQSTSEIKKDSSNLKTKNIVSSDSLQNSDISIDSLGRICFGNDLIQYLIKSDGKEIADSIMSCFGNALFHKILAYQKSHPGYNKLSGEIVIDEEDVDSF